MIRRDLVFWIIPDKQRIANYSFQLSWNANVQGNIWYQSNQ